MTTNAAIGAREAMSSITVPEIIQKLYPIRGGISRMLKVRVSGPTYELKDYLEHMEKDRVYQITSQSKPLKNKGTNKIFRVFTDVDKRTKIAAREKRAAQRK